MYTHNIHLYFQKEHFGGLSMFVSKFGGTSMANASQFLKVKQIIEMDIRRKVIVVSAPGKRYSTDHKVTDLLIDAFYDVDRKRKAQLVIERFASIIHELSLPGELLEQLQDDLIFRLHRDHLNVREQLDLVKAFGEEYSARLFAAYLQSHGLSAKYADPKEIGLTLTSPPSIVQLREDAFVELSKLRDTSDILVIPGFFGYTKEGLLRTFERGGSDITGSLVAAAVLAEQYENFTDVDSVFVANPTIIDQPEKLEEVTYREMRELSYAGFSVFHDEALMPVYRKQIPVVIKNTNNPAAPGTRISAYRSVMTRPVTGITADEGFSILYVSKYLMNRELGFGRKLLQVLEEEGISYEHTPSGLDDISVIIRSHFLDARKEQRIISRVLEELGAEVAYFRHGLSMIVLVGEGMRHSTGLAARATAAISHTGANIEMINQGSSEVSLVFGVLKADQEKIVSALYYEFFSAVKATT